MDSNTYAYIDLNIVETSSLMIRYISLPIRRIAYLYSQPHFQIQLPGKLIYIHEIANSVFLQETDPYPSTSKSSPKSCTFIFLVPAIAHPNHRFDFYDQNGMFQGPKMNDA